MSSTVSANEKNEAVRWLELRFESGYASGVHVARELIEVQEDHYDDCWYCENSVVTDDGFWWKPPSENVRDWYTEIAEEAEDNLVSDWVFDELPLPEPAAVFSLGPEYPTGVISGS